MNAFSSKSRKVHADLEKRPLPSEDTKRLGGSEADRKVLWVKGNVTHGTEMQSVPQSTNTK